MPATKDAILVMNAVAITGGSGFTFTGWQNLQTAYGGMWLVEVTNGANRQGKGVEVQAEVAPDQQAGNEWDYDCRRIAPQEQSATHKLRPIRIPPEVLFSRLRIEAGDEDCTVTVRFMRFTQI